MAKHESFMRPSSDRANEEVLRFKLVWREKPEINPKKKEKKLLIGGLFQLNTHSKRKMLKLTVHCTFSPRFDFEILLFSLLFLTETRQTAFNVETKFFV